MARKPMPGGDRNAWGQVNNEFLDVSHNPDGTIKPSAVQFAVTTEVEAQLGTQLQPAVEDAMANSTTLEGAVATAVDSNQTIINVNTRIYDARAYGTLGTADDSGAIQAALTAASPTGATVTFPAGTYSLQNTLDLGDAVLDLNGATLDFSTAALAAYSELVFARGELSALPAMSVTMAKYANEITFAAAHGLAIGDWVCVYNPADFSFSNVRDYYRDGQFFQVADVPSTTKIVTRGRAAATFPTTCEMSLLTPARGTIRNGTVKGKKGTPYRAMVLDLTAGSELSDMTAIDCEYELAKVSRSVDFRVSNVQGNNRMPEGVGDFYGVMVANSQSGYVEGSRVVSRRSAFSIGGTTGPGCVPSRFVRVRGNDFTTVGTFAGMGGHGNAEYIVYENNTVEGAVALAGDHWVIRDNDIYTYRAGAITGTSELLGFDHVIEGNRIYIRNTWTAFTDAPITVDAGVVGSGMQSPTVGSVTRSGGTLRVRGNNVFIEAQSVASNRGVVYIAKRTTCAASAINVDASNNLFTAGAITGASTMYGVVLRADDGVGFYNIVVRDNDFQNLPLYLWGAHAKTTTIGGNSVIDSKLYGIRIDANGSPYFSESTVDMPGNRIINAGGVAMRLLSSAGETIIVSDTTILNPNRNGTAGTEGSAIYATNAGTVILKDNIIGDTGGTALMQRYLTVTNTTLLIDRDNIRVGSVVGADVFTSTTKRLFIGDVVGDPSNVVFGHPGSIARSDSGHVYRKTTGGTIGWTTT